jgi:hypothetical protein
MSEIINHVLPGEEGGDTEWFSRQNEFEQREIERLVDYKQRHWPDLENGRLVRKPQHAYPHILPEGHVRKAFFEPITGQILSYLEQEDIALHSEALNLKSSQVACFNFLFPFRQNLSLASTIFNNFLPGVDEVEDIEFEYTGPLEATKWLGEPLGGKRGQNRTSIDAAVFWRSKNHQRHVSLIEWKYTEKSYGICSAFNNSKGEDKARCQSLNVAEENNPGALCQLTSGKRHRSRRYWEHQEVAGINLKAFSKNKGCPYQGPLYQLMRQHLLGTFLKESGKVDQFEVVSMGFANNQALQNVPDHLAPMISDGENEVIAIWNKALPKANQARHINVEEFLSQVDESENIDPDWRAYIRERYGI